LAAHGDIAVAFAQPLVAAAHLRRI
jgi:hypothetical protein